MNHRFTEEELLEKELFTEPRYLPKSKRSAEERDRPDHLDKEFIQVLVQAAAGRFGKPEGKVREAIRKRLAYLKQRKRQRTEAE